MDFPVTAFTVTVVLTLIGFVIVGLFTALQPILWPMTDHKDAETAFACYFVWMMITWVLYIYIPIPGVLDLGFLSIAFVIAWVALSILTPILLREAFSESEGETEKKKGGHINNKEKKER